MNRAQVALLCPCTLGRPCLAKADAARAAEAGKEAAELAATAAREAAADAAAAAARLSRRVELLSADREALQRMLASFQDEAALSDARSPSGDSPAAAGRGRQHPLACPSVYV
jgi:hypothetical protein